MIDSTEYKVKLEIFQGPMDLLLHLIRKNEVDIFDIPIAIITDQYLAYLDIMKALNIDVAGDFLVMASTLIHIKSRMLLPQFGEGDDEEDPRVEITRPLLEYMRLKEIAGELSERELLDRDVFKRSLPYDYTAQFQGEEPLLDINLFQLMDAFKRIVEQKLPGAQLSFKAHQWSIKERSTFIMDKLKEDSTICFKDLFKDDRTISEFIGTFLALLELVHQGLVRVFQPDPYKDIRLEAHFADKEEMDHE
ncbi:MAG: segregation/condensation protein A [Deltaproteobacteria bacterium]|nr:segregation/condensation protein A [Deltaproteobacteria bacterium]